MKIRIPHPYWVRKSIWFWYLAPWLSKRNSHYELRGPDGKMMCSHLWWWRWYVFPRPIDWSGYLMVLWCVLFVGFIAYLTVQIYNTTPYAMVIKG